MPGKKNIFSKGKVCPLVAFRSCVYTSPSHLIGTMKVIFHKPELQSTRKVIISLKYFRSKGHTDV